MLFLSKRLGDITVNDVAGMLPVFFGACIVIILISVVVIKMKDKENDQASVLAMNATIIDKQQVASNEIAFLIWVLFETENGDRVKLSCKANEDFVVGDKGYLQWQGSRLISFERRRNNTNG